MALFTEGKLFKKAGEGSGGGGGGDQHNLGWYATQAALEEAHPTATAGDWAIVGSTDTVWIWDTDDSEWVDSGSGGGNFVPAVSYTNVLYGTTNTGQQTQINYVVGSAGNTIALRDGQGRIQVGTPSVDADAATKKYVDDSIAGAGGLPDQTGQSGKFLTTDGTDASWSDKPLVNNTTESLSLAILGATSGPRSLAIGASASAGLRGVAVGTGVSAAGQSVAIGQSSESSAAGSVALGYGARVSSTASNAIQINASTSVKTNSDSNTFKVGNANGNFEIMSADGTVPTARLTKVNTTITLTAAGWSSNTQTVNVTGMTATGVVFVSPDPTDQADYTSAGITCSAQAAGTLTFTCSTTPANDIDVVVVML